MIYNERTAIFPLKAGETVEVQGFGNSMTPRLMSGQIVTVEPIRSDYTLTKGEIVLAKVNGHVYLHKVTAIRGNQVQIGNNHGHVNGWTSRANVYGRVLT